MPPARCRIFAAGNTWLELDSSGQHKRVDSKLAANPTEKTPCQSMLRHGRLQVGPNRSTNTRIVLDRQLAEQSTCLAKSERARCCSGHHRSIQGYPSHTVLMCRRCKPRSYLETLSNGTEVLDIICEACGDQIILWHSSPEVDQTSGRNVSATSLSASATFGHIWLTSETIGPSWPVDEVCSEDTCLWAGGNKKRTFKR